MLKKFILLNLTISFIFIQLFNVYAEMLPNIPFTKVKLTENDNYEHGFQRLAKVIKKCKGIECKVKSINQVTVKDHPEIQSKYKVTLESDTKWVKGHWIVDLVPYTTENMSITKAKQNNKEYNWWYVYYNNDGKPEAIAWARYGH